jgi:2-phosphosulfolactate phosphatase
MAECAVAIDVLRATTTIATALHAGAEAASVFASMEELMAASEAWPSDRRLRAGERGGAKVAGCDLGNSPFDCTPEVVGGKRIFASTTNGTRTLQRIQSASIVLAGALINRQAVVNFITERQPKTICLVGSGWEGDYSLEDTVCAGAIAFAIAESTGMKINELAGNDETIAAIALFQQWHENLVGLFHYASHGQRLLRLNCEEDINYCASLDIIDTIPYQAELGVLKKY